MISAWMALAASAAGARAYALRCGLVIGAAHPKALDPARVSSLRSPHGCTKDRARDRRSLGFGDAPPSCTVGCTPIQTLPMSGFNAQCRR